MVPEVPFDPDVPDEPLIPDVPDEPLPPEAPAKLIDQDVYVPEPSELVIETTNAPVTAL